MGFHARDLKTNSTRQIRWSGKFYKHHNITCIFKLITIKTCSHCKYLLQLIVLFYITDPILSVVVTAPNTQTVGQSLTLNCQVTTVRGISGRVDIVWRDNSGELLRMNDVSSTTISNSLVYIDSYTISQLSTTDDGRVIQCQVVINVNPEIVANDNYALDVNG